MTTMKVLVGWAVLLWLAAPVRADQTSVVHVGTTGATNPATGLAVGDVPALYAALDALPPGAVTVQLAANAIYVLDRNARDGGRIVLPDGVELAGGNVIQDYEDLEGNSHPDGIPDPVGEAGGEKIYALTPTILDGRTLVDQTAPARVRGVIEPGDGVRIRNLTVWSRGIGAAIAVRPSVQEKVVRIHDTILEGGRRGIHVTSLRPQGHIADDTHVRLFAERNVIRNQIAETNGWGVHFQQNLTANVRFSGSLRHNRLSGNRTGLFLVQSGSVDSEIDIVSHGNVIEEQHGRTGGQGEKSAGIWITRMMTGTIAPERCQLRLQSTDDAVWNNAGFGGLLIEGAGLNASSTSPFRDNETDVKLFGTRLVRPGTTATGEPFLQNRDTLGAVPRRRDIVIIGVVGTGVVPAMDNDLRVLVRGATSSTAPTIYDPAPEPLVIRNDRPENVRILLPGEPAFTRANDAPEFAYEE